MNNISAAQSQRAYHAMDGTQKKKAIDQSLEQLKKKFNKDDSTAAHISRQRIESVHEEPVAAIGFTGISPIIQANAQQLMSLVNNLYIGNLAPEVTEELLVKIYSKYGEVESLKLMLPRNEDERKRKRNCAFIKFYKYDAAYLAKEELGEKFLFGQQMRICWAKGISHMVRSAGYMADFNGVGGDQEVEMNYIESQLNHIIMNLELPTEEEILNKEYQFFEPHLPRIFIQIPSDPSVRYQIDKLAKQVVREGYHFEEEIKRILLKGKRVKSDLLVRLFTNQETELYQYYQWRAFSYFQGDSTSSWSQHPFQYYSDGIVIIPPRNPEDLRRLNPAKVIKEAMIKESRLIMSSLGKIDGKQEDIQEDYEKKELKNMGGIPLSDKYRDEILRYLITINCTTRSICKGMMLAIEHSQSSRDIADLITSSLISLVKRCSKKHPVEVKSIFAHLFLISDILFNSSNPLVSAAWSYRREFEPRLSQVFDHLNTLWSTKIEGLMSQKQVRKQATRILHLWKERTIYEQRILEGWEAMLKLDRGVFFSLNLRDPDFQPSTHSHMDKKLVDKMKLIVVPELKAYYKRLLDNKDKVSIECKLSGVPQYEEDKPENLIQRLVAIQEFKVRKLLKEKLGSEEVQANMLLNQASGEDLLQNKDYVMTQSLIQNFRKPLAEFDSSYQGELSTLVLTQDLRKPLFERAMQDVANEIQQARSHYLKLQQVILDIDENNIDGKPLSSEAVDFLHLNKHKLDRNNRLIELATRVLGNQPPELIDNISISSDELIAEQEDIDKGDEDIDGIEVPQEMLTQLAEYSPNDEYFSCEISDRQLKDMLSYARLQRLNHLKKIAKKKQDEALELVNQQIEQERQLNLQPMTIEEEITQAEQMLADEKTLFRNFFDRLDRHTAAFDKLTRYRKRLEKDIEYFVRDLQRQKLSNQEKQLRVIKKKVENYNKLNERIKEDYSYIKLRSPSPKDKQSISSQSSVEERISKRKYSDYNHNPTRDRARSFRDQQKKSRSKDRQKSRSRERRRSRSRDRKRSHSRDQKRSYHHTEKRRTPPRERSPKDRRPSLHHQTSHNSDLTKKESHSPIKRQKSKSSSKQKSDNSKSSSSSSSSFMSEEKEKPQITTIFDRITKRSELSSPPTKGGRGGGRGGNQSTRFDAFH